MKLKLRCAIVVLCAWACTPSPTQQEPPKPAPPTSAPPTTPAPPTSAPAAPPGLAEAARWEEARSLDGLAVLARAEQPEVRARTAQALGRVGAPEGLDLLARLMGDEAPPVRGAAAFAVGLIAAEHPDDPRLVARARQLLLGAWTRERDQTEDPAARRLVIWALRRVGGEDAGGVVTATLEAAKEERPAVQTEALRTLGILARFAPKTPGLDGPEVIEALQTAAASPEPEVREGALYAAMRLKRPELQPLLTATLAGDAEARPAEAALALRGLTGLETFDIPRARALLLGEGDAPPTKAYEVRVEAMRHLIAAGADGSAPIEAYLTQLLGPLEADGTLPEGAEMHVLLLAVEARGADKERPAKALMERLYKAARDPRVRRAEAPGDIAARATQLECEAAAAWDFLRQQLVVTPTCGDALPGQLTPGLRASYEVDVISRLNRPALGRLALLEDLYRRGDDPAVQVAALYAAQELLPEEGTPLDRRLQAELPKLREALERLGREASRSADPITRAAGLGLVARTNPDQAAAFIEETLAKLDPLKAPGPDLDLVLEGIDALKRLKKGEATLGKLLANPTPVVRTRAARTLQALQPDAPLTLPSPDLPPARPERLGQARRRAVIQTTRGPVTVELWPDIAPIAVESFERLAKRGFYDRLLFHRVIPTFVVQGGDPRGDGNGGPGTTLTAEWSDARFTRGVLGMAHAGKDTAGSQFFITTADQPHLDGGYTAFGRVVEGMTTVDTLLVGDRIVTIQAAP